MNLSIKKSTALYIAGAAIITALLLTAGASVTSAKKAELRETVREDIAINLLSLEAAKQLLTLSEGDDISDVFVASSTGSNTVALFGSTNHEVLCGNSFEADFSMTYNIEMAEAHGEGLTTMTGIEESEENLCASYMDEESYHIYYLLGFDNELPV
jgi:hypothetical protein